MNLYFNNLLNSKIYQEVENPTINKINIEVEEDSR